MSSQDVTQKPPRRWVSILLALTLSGGVGHFHAGRPRRALAWLGVQLLLAPTWALSTVLSGGNVFVYWGIALGFALTWLGQIADLWLLDRSYFVRTGVARLIVFLAISMGTFRGLAALLRSHVLESFRTPSGSMAPTLLSGDHLIVDKLGSISPSKAPARGDVIVFEFSVDDVSDHVVDYVKRVIGLPGDTIEVIRGRPSINGWPVPSCTVGRMALPASDDTDAEGTLQVEFLGENAYLTWYDSAWGQESEGPYVVLPNQVFVLGDNRNNSFDSRAWNRGAGAGVPHDDVQGRALSITLAFTPEQGLDPKRMGLSLQGRPSLPGAPARISSELERCLSERPRQTHPPAPRSSQR